jgi:hypothetical protein
MESAQPIDTLTADELAAFSEESWKLMDSGSSIAEADRIAFMRITAARKNASKTAIEGHRTDFQAKTVNYTAEAKKTAKKADFERLAAYIDAGFNLIARYDNGAAAADREIEATVTNRQQLAEWIEGKRGKHSMPITRYSFKPWQGSLIVMDIDRGHDDGADGVANLKDWLQKEGLHIAALDNLESFPAYTTTKSGGLHLYFKTDKIPNRERLQNCTLTTAVELKTSDCTAAGSATMTGVYTLKGAVKDAPDFPAVLLAYCKLKPEARPTIRPKRTAIDWQQSKKKEYEFTDCIEYAQQDSGSSIAGRHDLLLYAGRKAIQKGLTKESIKAAARIAPELEGLTESEIDSCIDSL